MDQAGPFQYTSILSLIDGLFDQVIDINDNLAVSGNFFTSVDGYNVYGSNDQSDYVYGYAPSVIAPLGQLDYWESTSQSPQDRKMYEMDLSGFDEYEYYWVRPYTSGGEGEQLEGQASVLVGAGR